MNRALSPGRPFASPALAATLALALAGASSSARAWESTCRQYPDVTLSAAQLLTVDAPGCSPDAGPNVARQRWVGPLDEHRELWERARTRAGLPTSVSATVLLRVFTASDATLSPVPFASTVRAHTRAFTPGELAQLPDFSYALWDWALGNETCPLDGAGADALECHGFSTHMGPVNSNHFLPQAGGFYAAYHALALARAADCRALADDVSTAGARFDAFVDDCEIEALAIEAVGDHYLQDAWSMGHMWQRWGSPDLSDFPGATSDDKRDRAVLVALVSGTVHGSRGVLQRVPAWAGLDVDDAMCAPGDDVEFVLDDGVIAPGLGDDYLADLDDASVQATRFFSCAVSGLIEVYTATAMHHGALAAPDPALFTVDPAGPACFGQRATNATMLRGAALDLKLAGQQVTVPLDSRLVSFMLPKVARQTGDVSVAPALRNQLRLSLQRTVTLARIHATLAPRGTEVADGRLGDLLAVEPNGAYGGATYLDPALPWPAAPGVVDADARLRADALARTFHRAHAVDWCAALTLADLDALRAHTADAALDATGRAAACEVCEEIAARHLRVGTDATSYDPAQEPLCTFVAATPAYAYEAAGDARLWCGC